MNSVEVVGLVKRFAGSKRPAVDHFELRAEPGEILAILGPSGCGKTTALRLIAGLEVPDAGAIRISGQEMVSDRRWVPPERRRVGLVFQDYALFPHLTALQNVRFGLTRCSRSQALEIARHKLDWVGLAGLHDRYPAQLSGGQQQRVALARALAPGPSVLLMDEPFSSLDGELRSQMRQEVKSLLKQAEATTIFVTHDREEAMFMGERLAIMQEGRLEQVGDPEELFLKPRSRFVAGFLGKVDFLPAVVAEKGVETELGLLGQKIDLPLHTMIDLMLRPDDVELTANPAGVDRIVDVIYQGMTVLYTVELPSGRRLQSLCNHAAVYAAGTRVNLRIAPGHNLHYFKPSNS